MGAAYSGRCYPVGEAFIISGVQVPGGRPPRPAGAIKGSLGLSFCFYVHAGDPRTGYMSCKICWEKKWKNKVQGKNMKNDISIQGRRAKNAIKL
mgnify:CR=1 FL=1